MTLNEHIYGEVQVYNFDQNQWQTVATLGDSTVIAAGTRRQCCEDGAFGIGGCFAGTMNLTCKLTGLTRYQVKGARVLLRRWFDGENNQGQNAPLEGIFWVTDAQKTGNIFTLSGQDAMLWADVSSYNHTTAEDGLSGGIYGFGEFLAQLHPGTGVTLQAWMLYAVQLANILAKRQTGMTADLLTWRDYSASENGGIDYNNAYIWTDSTTEDTAQPAFFWLYTDDGVYKDDNPRSFLRWLAQAAGGFLTVAKDGALTLRQFVQPSLGDAVIRMQDMAQDGEVADYRLQLYNTAVVYDDAPAAVAGGAPPAANGLVPYRITAESNPFLNGFRGYQSERAGQFRFSPVYGLAMSMYHYGAQRNVEARPFAVRVHTADRYELGQRVQFPDFRDLGESETHAFNSVITSVEWTFRGGTALSCGGEDSRIMADCVRATKADKAVRELRSRFKA